MDCSVVAATILLVLILLALVLRRRRRTPVWEQSSENCARSVICDINDIVDNGPTEGAHGALFRHVSPPLAALRDQYRSVESRWPEAAPHVLYDALSDMEGPLAALANATHAATQLQAYGTPWTDRARNALIRLPRDVRLLGVSLEHE